MVFTVYKFVIYNDLLMNKIDLFVTTCRQKMRVTFKRLKQQNHREPQGSFI